MNNEKCITKNIKSCSFYPWDERRKCSRGIRSGRGTIIRIRSILVCLFLSGAVSYATEVKASSASYADVLAAVASAGNGDTVVIPPGSGTWTQPLTVNKTITIAGAGAGATTINGNLASTAYLFEVNGNQGSSAVRITGLTLNNNGLGGGIRVLGTLTGAGGSSGGMIRIDHCEIKNTGWTTTASNYGRAVYFRGYKTYGLVDHCTFTNNSTNCEVGGDWTASWNDPVGLDTLNCVTLEDNTFTHNSSKVNYADTMFYNGQGSRTLFRNNTVNATDPNSGDLWDCHGNNELGYTSSANRGAIFAVVANNTINLAAANYGGKVFYIRGGIFICKGNTMTIGGTFYPYVLTEEECWYFAAGNSHYGQNWDTYPRQDQITNTWIWGNVINGVANNSAYAWDGGYPARQAAVNNCVQHNRDFFKGQVPPAYNATANFAASGPSHGYTAPAYPHPLVAAGGPNAGGAQSTISIEANQGLITAPFMVSGNTISQSVNSGDPLLGGKAVYTFNVTVAGQYAVAAQVNAPEEGANSFFVNLDTEPTATEMTWKMPVTSGFELRRVTREGSAIPQFWDLNVGTHQLIIRGREAGIILGRLSIVRRPGHPEGWRKGN